MNAFDKLNKAADLAPVDRESLVDASLSAVAIGHEETAAARLLADEVMRLRVLLAERATTPAHVWIVCDNLTIHETVSVYAEQSAAEAAWKAQPENLIAFRRRVTT